MIQYIGLGGGEKEHIALHRITIYNRNNHYIKFVLHTLITTHSLYCAPTYYQTAESLTNSLTEHYQSVS